MTRKHIYVVEDEEDIVDLVRFNLSKEGYQVSTTLSGEEALKGIPRAAPDLILLDLMLPGVDGLEICRLLKRDAKTAGVPIIMVTAKGEESDIVAGLELGADDYVTKPFSPKVLVARVRAVLRRRQAAPPAADDVLHVHDIVIDPSRHQVLCGKTRVELTATEFKLLHLLARRPGRVYTREQIVSSVKGDDYPVTDRSVDVQIVGLRRKLGSHGDCVETVRGVGYRFRE
jgi:two-component system, OmpR family, alkaline phosphatase synthesis response regulator PhoP